VAIEKHTFLWTEVEPPSNKNTILRRRFEFEVRNNKKHTKTKEIWKGPQKYQHLAVPRLIIFRG